MRVQFRTVGTIEQHSDVRVDLDAVPREGETVDLPGVPAEASTVRTVVWYPLGNPDEGESDPFVFVVLGSPRL